MNISQSEITWFRELSGSSNILCGFSNFIIRFYTGCFKIRGLESGSSNERGIIALIYVNAIKLNMMQTNINERRDKFHGGIDWQATKVCNFFY